ncbi:MAG TPA: type IV toxin-antitoxin system AbiEi family antitoxin domain-containing protein [Actinomycetota bacterium]
MTNDADRTCFHLAARQHGVVSRAQALQAGLSRSAISRRIAAGKLTEVLPGICAIAGVPATDRQRLMAACLWAGDGAVASHRAAAALWDIDGLTSAPVEISTTSGGSRPPKGVICHRVAKLAPGDVTRRHGIPVTNPARTLLDLGAVAGRRRVERGMHQLLRRGLVSVERLQRMVDEGGGRGRRGAGVLREILKACGPAYVPPESELEALVFNLLRGARLPMPVPQYRVRDEEGNVILRADFALVEDWLLLLIDGYSVHSDREAWYEDRRKRNAVVVLGWGVLVITYDDLCNRPHEVVASLRTARRYARRRSQRKAAPA